MHVMINAIMLLSALTGVTLWVAARLLRSSCAAPYRTHVRGVFHHMLFGGKK